MLQGPGNDIIEATMKILGKEIWDKFVRELRVTPSNTGAGGKYNGQDLKTFPLPREPPEARRLDP